MSGTILPLSSSQMSEKQLKRAIKARRKSLKVERKQLEKALKQLKKGKVNRARSLAGDIAGAESRLRIAPADTDIGDEMASPAGGQMAAPVAVPACKPKKPCKPCTSKKDPCTHHYAAATFEVEGRRAGAVAGQGVQLVTDDGPWSRLLHAIGGRRAHDIIRARARDLPTRIGAGQSALVIPADADSLDALQVEEAKDGSAVVRLPPEPAKPDRLLMRFFRSRNVTLIPAG